MYAQLPSAFGIESYIPLESYIEEYWRVFHNALIFRLIQLGAKRIEFHLSQEQEKVLGIKTQGQFKGYGVNADFRSRESFKQTLQHIIKLEKPQVSQHKIESDFTILDEISSSGSQILIDGFLAVRKRLYGGQQKLVINIQKQIEKHLGFNLFAWLIQIGGECNYKKAEKFNCSIDVIFFSQEEYL